MSSGIDNKKYSGDRRSYRDAVLQDSVLESFEDSPISKHLTAKDICIYKPGDLNKIGKEGRTSWDSFSYALQMGHNVWMHVESTQRANREYDNGHIPGMLVDERFDRVLFKDIVDRIFSLNDREKSLALIEEYSKFWMMVIGTRLNIGKKTVNALTNFSNLFDTGDTNEEEDEVEEFNASDHSNLEALEQNQE